VCCHACVCVRACAVADFFDPTGRATVTRPDAGSSVTLSTAQVPSASVQPAVYQTFTIPSTGHFTWLTTAHPLSASGLRRWAIQLVANNNWSFGMGVSNHFPVDCAALCQEKTSLVVHISSERCVFVSNSTGDAFHKRQALIPRPPTAKHYTGSAASRGMVLTFEADLKANTLSVQFHKPDAIRLPFDKTPTVPSTVMTLSMPEGLSLAQCRPTLAMWGACVVAEVEANATFRSLHRGQRCVFSSPLSDLRLLSAAVLLFRCSDGRRRWRCGA
jgi:hypothetical protein